MTDDEKKNLFEQTALDIYQLKKFPFLFAMPYKGKMLMTVNQNNGRDIDFSIQSADVIDAFADESGEIWWSTDITALEKYIPEFDEIVLSGEVTDIQLAPNSSPDFPQTNIACERNGTSFVVRARGEAHDYFTAKQPLKVGDCITIRTKNAKWLYETDNEAFLRFTVNREADILKHKHDVNFKDAGGDNSD